MTVNHEIKSHLAKLLATEDLVVEHKRVETASFNVHTRVLTLPMWDRASSSVYDMLVGHEVGHALYTPDVDWFEERSIPPQIVNVCEDARIEKLMKRRYAGISKTFYRGYNELSDEDFFALENEDIPSMNLADRANLYFKIGNFTSIPIEEGVESEILQQIADAETFEETLDAAEVLYKYCVSPKEKVDDNEELPPTSGNPDEGQQQESQTDQEESEENDSYGGTAEKQPGNNFDDEDIDDEDIDDAEKVKTMEAFEESLKNLIDKNQSESVYLEIPKVDLKNVIVPNQDIHNLCNELWDNPYDPTVFDIVDSEFLKFKKSAQKEVNYLVKEFECKKAADSYARATTARTGVLDCTKLHTYKYNEDLFKKVTTLADGKNHGLIFVLDWSGSMTDVMLDTVKQLFNLIWFCKKVNIPFDVYAFTNEYPLISYDEDENSILRTISYERKEGLLHVGEYFSMMNLLTHKTNAKELNTQLNNIWRLAWYFSRYSMYNIPIGLGLSGTPLNESLVSLHQIIPQFKKETKAQKVQCVILTDGESYQMKYHRVVKRRWEDEPFIGVGSVHDDCILRDRKTGNTYALGGQWWKFTEVLLRNLRDNFKDTNFIGIRVLPSREANAFIRQYCDWNPDLINKATASWKKNKAFALKSTGYHTYFGLSSNALNQESEFTVSEDASKTQIKSAFAKSLKSKKMNKKILSEFIELVA